MSGIARTQTPFGELRWSERLHWWEGDAISVPLFNDRALRASIPWPNEAPENAFAPDILNAAEWFLALKPAALDPITPHVWAYFNEVSEMVEEEPSILPGEDIWTHVSPVGFSLPRRRRDGRIYVSIECGCSWEPEHGLQLVALEGVRWVRVGPYTGALTDGDGYASERLDAWMGEPHASLPIRTFDDMMAIRAGKKR